MAEVNVGLREAVWALSRSLVFGPAEEAAWRATCIDEVLTLLVRRERPTAEDGLTLCVLGGRGELGRWVPLARRRLSWEEISRVADGRGSPPIKFASAPPGDERFAE